MMLLEISLGQFMSRGGIEVRYCEWSTVLIAIADQSAKF